MLVGIMIGEVWVFAVCTVRLSAWQLWSILGLAALLMISGGSALVRATDRSSADPQENDDSAQHSGDRNARKRTRG
jgi:hypothetical protein